MQVEDLPYRAEYAKSNRASCRGCKSTIGKETLRLAVMVQSPMFDGKVPHWYHMPCFFTKQRPKTVGDISHFESLRWEDQKTIEEKISTLSTAVVAPAKGKKRAANTPSKGALKDFLLEYSKSSRAVCRGCEQKIMKDEIRISKKDYETEVGKRYGGQDMWHHLTCFVKLRADLGYFESGDKLPGFRTLSAADQSLVKKELPAKKPSEVPIKQPKLEDQVDGSKMSKEEAKLKQQNELMFKHRDLLKKLTKSEMQLLLEANEQEIPAGEDRILDRLSDIMTFGALERCSKCGDGQFVFKKNGYVCQGDLTEWTKCNEMVSEPKRVGLTIPSELQEKYKFLAKYKYVARNRIIHYVASSGSSLRIKKEEDEADSAPKVQREKPPLYYMEFVILGQLNADKEALKKQIGKLGGKVVTKIHDKVMAVISTPAEVERMGSRMSEVQDKDVHVVGEDFVEEAAKATFDQIGDLVVKKSICTWGSDPSKRITAEPAKSMKSKSGSSMFTKSVPSKMTYRLKNGTAVDPDSGLEDKAHVYTKDGDKFTCVLGLVDIQKQKNSFYKLQLLESDRRSKYWVFRAWGRTGTTVGSNKVESMESLHEAKKHFKALYQEKTGNVWEHREHFVKVPGRMYPIDVDFGPEEDQMTNIDTSVESKLAKPVHDLIKLIFDVDTMKKVMMEYELDTERMPLGKLSKKQLQSAYAVLSELQVLVEKSGSQAQFIDASNRFYTFVPHNFGISDPPILNSKEMIMEKLEMVESLMELEIAYNLMKTTDKSGDKHPVDSHYEQLRAELDVLDKGSEHFQLIEEYVKNTHAETHQNYELKIEEVFSVKRHGEEKRFKPFKKLHNRQLLWHGSRLTNYASILSQGLRIAPPEAPSSGYMFGKGIYFADMVSKSANYCCTTPSNPTGLIMLCEVALGDMHEMKEADFITKLPKGKHSVKGLGMTHPDAAAVKELDGVKVPLGKGVKNNKIKSSLLYNEYIVYDVAQVNMKYLLKVNFKYKF